MWRARSASDKTDDWPFWYVTDDKPENHNKTLDAIEELLGIRPCGLPFVPKDVAIEIAEKMNNATV